MSRPVIGIVTRPGDGTGTSRLCRTEGVSYIAASYVKLIECGGACVIPLIYNEQAKERDEKLKLVNGVLFTGTSVKAGRYRETADCVFEHAKKKKKDGVHFPVYGIGDGFQLLTMIVSGCGANDNILADFTASNLRSSLQFTEANTSPKGTVFQSFAPDLLTELKRGQLVLHDNSQGISPVTFRKNLKLSSSFEILTTSKDDDINPKEFVSTARAKKYPVTIFQWHPEKNAFEWASSGNQPHTEDAIRVTQSVANFLASEARKCPIAPDPQKVRNNLIYNYAPTYCGMDGRGYDQVYLFK